MAFSFKESKGFYSISNKTYHCCSGHFIVSLYFIRINRCDIGTCFSFISQPSQGRLMFWTLFSQAASTKNTYMYMYLLTFNVDLHYLYILPYTYKWQFEVSFNLLYTNKTLWVNTVYTSFQPWRDKKESFHMYFFMSPLCINLYDILDCYTEFHCFDYKPVQYLDCFLDWSRYRSKSGQSLVCLLNMDKQQVHKQLT